ncbi:MAG: hypothetical protein PWR21_1891 [Methanoculleus sp.]|jgi:hypothetical protein|nr:hypothetical protein [Methanoculleus sp.]MDN5339319.1 hypothetical protein [Euryarchaeota archaeon]
MAPNFSGGGPRPLQALPPGWGLRDGLRSLQPGRRCANRLYCRRASGSLRLPGAGCSRTTFGRQPSANRRSVPPQWRYQDWSWRKWEDLPKDSGGARMWTSGAGLCSAIQSRSPSGSVRSTIPKLPTRHAQGSSPSREPLRRLSTACGRTRADSSGDAR